MLDAVLETERPLSQSRLFELQRRYFQRIGPRAWTEGGVPEYITTHPRLAAAMASVVIGYLEDAELDRSAPVYVLELGGGTGRFAFHFLRRLEALLALRGWVDLQVRYVLTDLADANVTSLRSTPALAPDLASGRLVVSRFDVEQDHAPAEPLPGRGANPLVAIANYVFDGLPQDLFAVHGGRLEEYFATLHARDPVPDHPPSALSGIAVSLDRRAVAMPRYGDPDLDALLELYRRTLGDAVIGIPCGAIQCLRRVESLSGGRLLFLVADKGHHRLRDLEAQGEPELVVHGSFSLPVNLHALSHVIERDGGTAFFPAHLPAHLTVGGWALDRGSARAYPRTAFAFAQALEMSPDDLYSVRKALDPAALTVPQLLALLRLTAYDERVLAECLPAIQRALPALAPLERDELRAALVAAERACFGRHAKLDLPFELGLLLYALEVPAAARACFERSLAESGDDAAVYFNLALCQERGGEPAAARASVTRALELDPGLAAARELEARWQRGA